MWKWPAISPFFKKRTPGAAPEPALILVDLQGAVGKVVSGGFVSQWQDQSGNANNANQSTVSARPSDNSTYLGFDGNDNMIITDNTALNIKSRLTIIADIETSSAVAFAGVVDKYDGGLGRGYATFLSGTGKYSLTAALSKANIAAASVTSVNDGVRREIKTTVELSRKFKNKQYSFDGEEPKIIKVGSTYYVFYSRYDGSTFNIYRRSGSVVALNDSNSTETLVLAGFHYCSIMQDPNSSDYRLVVTDLDNENFILYTSATIDGTYSLEGTLLTFGDAVDANHFADPYEWYDGSLYHLSYSAFSAPSTPKVADATSATGLPGSYTKQGVMIDVGSLASDFDKDGTADPCLFMVDGVLHIFYTGINLGFYTSTKQQQGFARYIEGVWVKSGVDAVHYWTGETWEGGSNGPNEMCPIQVGNKLQCLYRANNEGDATLNTVGYVEFDISGGNIVAGNETITTTIYLDGVPDSVEEDAGIDYILPSTGHNMYLAGDNASTLYLAGNFYNVKIYNGIV